MHYSLFFSTAYYQEGKDTFGHASYDIYWVGILFGYWLYIPK